MPCGAKYAKEFLVTESKATPTKPWDWFPGPDDYDEWYDVIGKVERAVRRKWEYLLKLEELLAKMEQPPVSEPYPERVLIETKLAEFVAQTEQVHGVLRELAESAAKGEWSWETSIRRAIEAGETGCCVLELID